MSDDKKGFTVKDRRLFTPEGERRGADEDEATASPPAVAEAPPPPRLDTPRSDAPPSLGAEVDFASFLMSLAAQAGALLEAEGAQELEGARQIISILEMLATKTEGRRTPEEDRILERLLYELRMAYVERVRAARA
jgi:hypothetical protein